MSEVAVRGARLVIDRDGEFHALARIPSERPVFRLTGAAGGASVDLRDDAVVIVRAALPIEVRITPLFDATYAESARGSRLLLDEAGGFGAYPTRPARSVGPPPFAWTLRPEDELWLAIYPSRQPSPLRQSQEIAHEGRPRPFPDGAYPSTAVIEDAARSCDVFALHAYFWDSGPRALDLRAGRYALRRRPWTTARHVPSDPDRFARVREDVHRTGMKLVVYLSPRHSTAPDLFEEMERVLDEYGVDGLYLDGISDDFRRSEAVVRRTREILGPDRILYLNASDEPFGTPRVFCPFIDAQADFVLRGDSGRGGLSLDRFLRFAVSGRNISNAVGVWCHYGSSGGLPVDRAPSARPIDAALANGVRIWRRSVWGNGLSEFDRLYHGARPSRKATAGETASPSLGEPASHLCTSTTPVPLVTGIVTSTVPPQ